MSTIVAGNFSAAKVTGNVYVGLDASGNYKDTSGRVASLQAVQVNATNVTAVNLNVSGSLNPTNLAVPGSLTAGSISVSTTQGNYPIALINNGYVNINVPSLPKSTKHLINSCEHVYSNTKIAKQTKALGDKNVKVLCDTYPAASGVFSEQQHTAAISYANSLKPDAFFMIGDENYNDIVFAHGNSYNTMHAYSETYANLTPQLRQFFGWVADGSGSTPGAIMKAGFENGQDACSDIWVQNSAARTLYNQCESRGGVHFCYDDHDIVDNDNGGLAGMPVASMKANRSFYQDKLNGWSGSLMVDGFDSSGVALTRATMYDASGNNRKFADGTVYNGTNPQLYSTYRSWDQFLDNSGTQFKVRYIMLDDDRYKDMSTGCYAVRDTGNTVGMCGVFYPQKPVRVGDSSNNYNFTARNPYTPWVTRVDVSGNLSLDNGKTAVTGRFIDSSGNNFEYLQDLRYADKRTMYSEAQWTWWQNLMLDAQAKSYNLIVIISGSNIWFDNLANDNISSCDADKLRLINFIKKNRIDNLVFSGGDNHYAAVFKNQTHTAYPMYTIMGSGLSQGKNALYYDAALPAIHADYVYGTSFNDPRYNSPSTGDAYTPAGSVIVQNAISSARLYQMMEFDIIMPGAIDNKTGLLYVDASGKPIAEPTLRALVHSARDLSTADPTYGTNLGQTPWIPEPTFYDIKVSTLKHPTTGITITPTWIETQNTIYTGLRKNANDTDPTTDHVFDASGNGVRNIRPYNKSTKSTGGASLTPMIDTTGQYLTDSSGNLLVRPIDLYFELCPFKTDTSGRPLDSSGIVITSQVYYPKYGETYNSKGFLVYDLSQNVLVTDISSNPITPKDSSGNIARSLFWYPYGASSMDYLPGSYSYNVIPAYIFTKSNPSCPYVEDVVLNPATSAVTVYTPPSVVGMTVNNLVSQAIYAGNLLTPDKVSLTSTGVDYWNATVLTKPTRKYYVTVTRDPSGFLPGIDSSNSRTFLLPLSLNQNGIYHAMATVGVESYLDSTKQGPFPYGYGFTPVGYMPDTQVFPFSGWAAISNTNTNIQEQSIDGFDRPQKSRLFKEIVESAGYVGETPTFKFFSVDTSNGLQLPATRADIATVSKTLQYRNNAIFTNVPGQNELDLVSTNGAWAVNQNSVATLSTPPYVLHMLEYQATYNCMLRMLYGAGGSGYPIPLNGVTVKNTKYSAATADAYDPSGNYTVNFVLQDTSSLDIEAYTYTDTNGKTQYLKYVYDNYNKVYKVQDLSSNGITPITKDGSGNPYTTYSTYAYKNMGTSKSLMNLYYEYNSFLNQVYTTPTGSVVTANKMFKDPSCCSVSTQITDISLNNNIYPSQELGLAATNTGPPVSSNYLSNAAGAVSSFDHRQILALGNDAKMKNVIPRSVGEIWRQFNRRYFDINSNLFTEAPQKVNTQLYPQASLAYNNYT
jgi:hypothetical protein